MNALRECSVSMVIRRRLMSNELSVIDCGQLWVRALRCDRSTRTISQRFVTQMYVPSPVSPRLLRIEIAFPAILYKAATDSV
jgi:hypothetical protein